MYMLQGNRDYPQIADYLKEISIFACMCVQKLCLCVLSLSISFKFFKW